MEKGGKTQRDPYEEKRRRVLNTLLHVCGNHFYHLFNLFLFFFGFSFFEDGDDEGNLVGGKTDSPLVGIGNESHHNGGKSLAAFSFCLSGSCLDQLQLS